MACSKYEYVKHFENASTLLKNTFLVVRIDGHSFHRFTKIHNYRKPNDPRGINLMNACAIEVMKEFNDIILAYGQSDEYSFVFPRETALYGRREAKIETNLVSLFTSAFVFKWKDYFEDTELQSLPSFDARCVLYPTAKNLRDYLSWRQADCHINNLYNTAFWELVQNPSSLKTEQEAESILKLTDSGGKNELLFQFGINYNKLDPMYRKGTTISRESVLVEETSKNTGEIVKRKRKILTPLYVDIIGEEFWKERPHLIKE
ncbi:tRNA-histidine guanylyltransferase 1-like [Boothiomyces macroporosus]|uniref:tRNA(His) guanylyltransferase n=1 Tax=Boothiomyces macroporosus TaxID=261099 RepID=A0AAD5Y8R8_9FUNG|nr:tRNA-histidine guanylyltransferase 1-like [Boothiomyces macroporosus]